MMAHISGDLQQCVAANRLNAFSAEEAKAGAIPSAG
jgi:hypothetical protein